MTRARLEQIKQEINANPAAFQKDGHAYFVEFLPILEKAFPKEEPKKEAPKAEAKKPEPPKVEQKKVEVHKPKVVFAGKLKKKKK